MSIDELEHVATELRFTCVVSCPDCPEDFEENEGAIKHDEPITCPKCSYTWIHSEY